MRVGQHLATRKAFAAFKPLCAYFRVEHLSNISVAASNVGGMSRTSQARLVRGGQGDVAQLGAHQHRAFPTLNLT